MPFVKLDCGILNSTLWFEHDAREVFITALLMAEPFELREPTPQIKVDALGETGWVVPPGWYGFVPAAGVGITHRAGLKEGAGRAALEILGAPEQSSRSPEFDGRRLVRIDGGYIVLNYIKYRERDMTTADRSKRWRERQKAKTTRVSGDTTRVIRHQAEAEVQAEAVRTHTLAEPTPPVATGPHRSHAFCSVACVPAFLHAEFRRGLNRADEDEADRDLRAGYRAHVEAWPAEKPTGDAVAFWRGWYKATYPVEPATSPALARKLGPTYTPGDWYLSCQHEPKCETGPMHRLREAIGVGVVKP